MNLQISPFGVIIASPFYLLAYLLLFRLWRKFRTSAMRWGILALTPIVLALPFADEFWIAWRFREACKDAGVHVYKTATVAGFYDDTSPWNVDLLRQSGYRFVEYREPFGSKVVHLEQDNGVVRETTLDKSTARYRYQFANLRQEVGIGYRLEKWETHVFDSKANEVIARETSFNRYPGLIEGLWIHFMDRGQTICSRPLDDDLRKTLTGVPYSYALLPSGADR